MLGGDAYNVVSAASLAFGHAADREIVALRRATGEHDFAARGVNDFSDLLPGVFHHGARPPPEIVSPAAGIASLLQKIWPHRFKDPRVYRRCCVVIEIGRFMAHSFE